MNYQQMDLKRGVDYIGVTCVFFCHDGKGRVLLHKRSANCRDEHGRWDCGGGSMEFGETFEEAVRREVKEEYCVDPSDVILAKTVNVLRDNNGTSTHWIAAIHAVEVDPNSVKIGEPDKMEDVGWFYPEEFPEERHSMLDPHFDIVRKFISKNYEC